MIHFEIIDFLKKEKVEHIIVVKNDEIIADFIGDKFKVSIDNNKLYLLKNSTLYHNHLKRNTFSESDVFNFLMSESNIMYLVTQNFIYSIKRPSNINCNKIAEALKGNFAELDALANEEIDKLILTQNISFDEANIEKSHYIWLYLSHIYGLEYKRKAI